MRYREIKPRWKYLLGANYAITTGILPSAIIDVPYLHLDMAGILTIEGGAEGGYMWDGPSGPMRDTPTAMRGSLVHDAFYQLLRMGLLDYDPCKRQADELQRRCTGCERTSVVIVLGRGLVVSVGVRGLGGLLAVDGRRRGLRDARAPRHHGRARGFPRRPV